MATPVGSKGGKSKGTGKNGFSGGNGGNIQAAAGLEPATGLEFNNREGKRGLGDTQLQPDKKGLGRAELEADPTLNKNNPSSDILPKNNISPTELRTLNIDESATNIGTGAFRNTRNLQGTITGGGSLIRIGPLSFMGSGAIGIAGLISGQTTSIDGGAFQNSGVKGRIILGPNITNVGEGAFRSTNINALQITDNEFMTINSNAFRDCRNLKEIYVDVAPQVFSGTGHFQIGNSRSRFTVETIEVDTTNSTRIGLPKLKKLMRPNVVENFTYMAQDPNEIEYTEIEIQGTYRIFFEYCTWKLEVQDNNVTILDSLYVKDGVGDPADYYNPDPNAQYIDPEGGFGYIKLRILDRDKPDPPSPSPVLSVRAEDFDDYNCGAFREQTGFSGTIIARDPIIP
jgi:hypothetical protein